jgi:hypothetical protein
MAKNKTMRSFLPAIALCALLQPALAGNSTASVRPAVTPATPLVIQASLTPTAAVQAGAAPADGATPMVVASIKGEAGDPKPTPEDEHRPTTVAVLLTAFFVMTGIALRRLGTEES